MLRGAWHVGVFGLGKAGNAAVEFLRARGCQVYAWDDKGAARAALLDSCLRGNDSDNICGEILLASPESWPWGELQSLVMSPGIALTHPVVQRARAHGVEVVGEVEILQRHQPDAKYIGITGTNGKSTTTALLGHVLSSLSPWERDGVRAKAAAQQPEEAPSPGALRHPLPGGEGNIQIGGNLGTPALALKPLGNDGAYVLEMSSYQLDLIHKARFNIGVFLNLTPDHLERHGDMEGYFRAKMRMFANMRDGDTAVIAVDDDYTRRAAAELRARGVAVVTVSSSLSPIQGEGAVLPHLAIEVKNGILRDNRDGFSADISDIPTLLGAHNWQNAAASFAAARAHGCGAEEVVAALRTYPGLPHRLEMVAEICGVRFINDSKATNADAVQHALNAFAFTTAPGKRFVSCTSAAHVLLRTLRCGFRKLRLLPWRSVKSETRSEAVIYWILGGQAKAGGIESLREFFPRIAHAFLIGAAAEEFARTLEGQVPYTMCGTLENAVPQAAVQAWKDGRAGAVVLLSPACASWDQFKSFEHRGDVFRELVGMMGR